MLDMLTNGFQFLAVAGKDWNFCRETKGVWSLVGSVVFWIQIAVPVLIILLGTIDLAKAVISGDEKKIKENQSTFIRRVIYGVAIFFIVLIVQLVFGAVADSGATTSGECFKCVQKRGDC